MEKKNQKRLLAILILLIIALNYNFIDSSLLKIFNSKDIAVINEVIDGDTAKTNGTSIRLLGINTPEKGELYYNEAKEFLKDLILNKTVYLEYGKERKDKYDRTLAYIFLENESVNIQLIENGFANFYFPSGRDKYFSQYKEAWENCIESNKNLCEKSNNKCSACISKEFDFEDELIVLKNACSFECDLNNWTIEAEGRKMIKLNFTLNHSEEKDLEFETLWAQEGGNTFFLRDDEFKLVLWENF